MLSSSYLSLSILYIYDGNYSWAMAIDVLFWSIFFLTTWMYLCAS